MDTALCIMLYAYWAKLKHILSTVVSHKKMILDRHVPCCDVVVVLCATLQGDPPPLTGGHSRAARSVHWQYHPPSNHPQYWGQHYIHTPYTIYHIPALHTLTVTILPPAILNTELNTTSIHHILADGRSVTAHVNILYSRVFMSLLSMFNVGDNIRLHMTQYKIFQRFSQW